MKQRPILFSTEMVQAILAGRKTQTRRVIKDQPKHDQEYGQGTTKTGDRHWVLGVPGSSTVDVIKCPYGQPGDVLWVRETLERNVLGGAIYRAGGKVGEKIGCNPLAENEFLSWDEFSTTRKVIRSIHMPKDAARIWLRITNVRVQRLQNITEEDAIQEGSKYLLNVRAWFSDLWKSINGADSWNANPWVWVVEFERIEKPKSE